MKRVMCILLTHAKATWYSTSIVAYTHSLRAIRKTVGVAQSTATKDEQCEHDSTIKTLGYKATSDECTETSYVSIDDEIIRHFITMVHINGGLYELDGQKYGPVRHGGTTQDSLLEDACRVVEEFMKHDPDSWCYTIMALVPKKE